jgi:hypothetical protein
MRRASDEKETKSKKASAKAADDYRGIARRHESRAEKIQAQSSEPRESSRE